MTFIDSKNGSIATDDMPLRQYKHKIKERFSILGKWIFRALLYILISIFISALLKVIMTNIYETLDMTSGNKISFVFIIFATLLHFFAFKKIFFKKSKIRAALLVYTGTGITLMLTFFAIALIATKMNGH